MEMARCVVCVMSDTVFDVYVFYVVPTQGAFTCVCFVCVLCSVYMCMCHICSAEITPSI